MSRFQSSLKMAQIAKISEQVQLKCSGEKFYEFFKNKMDCLSQMFPENLTSFQIVEGNGFAHGSVIYWKYNFGCPLEGKTRLVFDDPNKTLTLEFVEGDLFRDYEMLQVKGEVSDGGSNGLSSVKWSAEFVKANEDVVPPHNYVQFGVKSGKGIEAHLCNISTN